jgi:hypothetical protein
MTQSNCTSSSTNMENKCGLLQALVVTYLLGLIFMLSLSPTMAQEITELDIEKQSSLQTYIVHVKKPEGKMAMESEDLESWYESFLPLSIGRLNQQPRMVYSYRKVATGFAARLTEEEVKAMEKKDGFISARQERILPLQTTHSPNFLGLHKRWDFGKAPILAKV